jgi:hypothetical protein
MLMLFQTTLSAVSGIYNQKLCQGSEGSLHAMNMALYSYGSFVNVILHFIVAYVDENEPGFFEGILSIGPMAIILCNCFIGLAITAVYKCK